MTEMMTKLIQALSDSAIVESLKKVLCEERAAVTRSIEYLLEITARDIPARMGYPSLFAFLTKHCRLSESAASKRSAALGLARRFPEVLILLTEGRLHLSNCSLIARHVTRENRATLIQAACERPYRDLEVFVAQVLERRAPTRDVVKPVVLGRARPEVRKETVLFEVGARSAMVTSSNEGTFDVASEVVGGGDTLQVCPPRGECPPQCGVRVSVTLESEAAEALDALRKGFPGRSVAEIVAQALIRERDRTSQAKRLGPKPKVTRAPKGKATSPSQGKVRSATETSPEAKPRSRQIAQSVKREVFARDGGRCSYVSPEGHRCDCTTRLEFDHLVPFASGGANEVSNVFLKCRLHNLLAAKDAFGKGFVEGHYRYRG